MNNKNYSTYQYSVFLNGGRDEQLVIRTDTFEELIEAKKNIDKIVTKREEAPRKLVHAENDIPGERYCDIHKKPMKLVEGPYGEFYSHSLGKDAQGKWQYCKGK